MLVNKSSLPSPKSESFEIFLRYFMQIAEQLLHEEQIESVPLSAIQRKIDLMICDFAGASRSQLARHYSYQLFQLCEFMSPEQVNRIICLTLCRSTISAVFGIENNLLTLFKSSQRHFEMTKDSWIELATWAAMRDEHDAWGVLIQEIRGALLAIEHPQP